MARGRRLSGGRQFGPKTLQDPTTYEDARRTAWFQKVGVMDPALELILGRTAKRRTKSGEALCGLATWWHELRSPTKGGEQERHCHQLNLELQTDLGFWLRIQGRAEPLSTHPPSLWFSYPTPMRVCGPRVPSPCPTASSSTPVLPVYELGLQ